MQPEADALDELRTRIATYLNAGHIRYSTHEDGSYIVKQGAGSTLVSIQPMNWKSRTLVKIVAPLAVQITTTSGELGLWLAQKNNALMFGRFSLDLPRSAVWLEHILLGDYLDADELLAAVSQVALLADEYDEQVAAMAGGKRAADV